MRDTGKDWLTTRRSIQFNGDVSLDLTDTLAEDNFRKKKSIIVVIYDRVSRCPWLLFGLVDSLNLCPQLPESFGPSCALCKHDSVYRRPRVARQVRSKPPTPPQTRVYHGPGTSVEARTVSPLHGSATARDLNFWPVVDMERRSPRRPRLVRVSRMCHFCCCRSVPGHYFRCPAEVT